MNGIIGIYKPQGFTSFDVIAKLRGITKTRRIGHAGTLDPLATGVLPVFFGRATKACDLLPDSDKVYEADFRLGLVTDTQDSTGNILSEAPVSVDEKTVQAALEGFRGEGLQIPPMYAAIKVDGKKLYDLARQGIEVERKPRPITVYDIALLAFDGVCGKIRVSCSKGTYIRTICHDLGEKLGCGAVMTALSRTRAAGIDLAACYTLEQVQALCDSGAFETALRPLDAVFSHLPRIDLTESLLKKHLNGIKLDQKRLPPLPAVGESVALFAPDGRFVGLGLVVEENAQTLLRSQTQFLTLEDFS